MTLIVFAAVLLAALMHAGWNALFKVGLDRVSSLLLLCLSQLGLCLILLPFFPLPVWDAWPWILVSALIHVFYKISLLRAYDHGDLSQVYPLARGSAPLIVAVVSATFLGEVTTVMKTVAIISIGSGVCLMSLKGGATGRMPPKAFLYAITTAMCTASYTLVDGWGARLSGSPSGFLFLASILDGLLTCAYVLVAHGTRAFTRLAPAWRPGVAAGAMALSSYWIVIWAFTQAPIALVAALRETSVLFAVAIAVLYLKERVGWTRIAAAGLIACGVVLMRL